MTSELSNSKKAWSVLIVSTLAFTVCFYLRRGAEIKTP